MRALLILFTVMIFTGCSSAPWEDYPTSTPPDRQCRTGHEAGHDVYLWDCLEGRHIAVFQYCTGMMGCQEPEKETSSCGELTPMETRFAEELTRCVELPPERRWR
ncbi:MAG: hypothetical protein DRJ42_14655 [Deltaproteobacteria bacterium]|nr:MAG: hypothetical protein DRJ42_14655 [Deltaproteobacteria bacterium]